MRAQEAAPVNERKIADAFRCQVEMPGLAPDGKFEFVITDRNDPFELTGIGRMDVDDDEVRWALESLFEALGDRHEKRRSLR